MLELIELVGRLFHGLRVWQVIFSSRYRQKVRSSWVTKRRAVIAFEIFEYAIGFTVTIVVVYALMVALGTD